MVAWEPVRTYKKMLLDKKFILSALIAPKEHVDICRYDMYVHTYTTHTELHSSSGANSVELIECSISFFNRHADQVDQ